MATADRQQEIYDAVLSQLRLLCRCPGITGAFLLDEDSRLLAGSGVFPEGQSPPTPDHGRAMDSVRKQFEGVASNGFCGQFHQSPGYRFYLLDLGHHLRLLSFCTAGLNPALIHRSVDPIAKNIDQLLNHLLQAGPGLDELSAGTFPATPDSGPTRDPVRE